MMFVRLQSIEHSLDRWYAALRGVKRRHELVHTPFWAEIADEVTRVTSAVERGESAVAGRADSNRLRVCAWNISAALHGNYTPVYGSFRVAALVPHFGRVADCGA